MFKMFKMVQRLLKVAYVGSYVVGILFIGYLSILFYSSTSEREIICKDGNHHTISNILANKNDPYNHFNHLNNFLFSILSNDNMYRIVCSYSHFNPYDNDLPMEVKQAQMQQLDQASQPFIDALKAELARRKAIKHQISTKQVPESSASEMTPAQNLEYDVAYLADRAYLAVGKAQTEAQAQKAYQTYLAYLLAFGEQTQAVAIGEFNNTLSAMLPLNYTIVSFSWRIFFFSIGGFLILTFLFSIMMKLIRYTVYYILNGQRFGVRTFFSSIF